MHQAGCRIDCVSASVVAIRFVRISLIELRGGYTPLRTGDETDNSHTIYWYDGEAFTDVRSNVTVSQWETTSTRLT